MITIQQYLDKIKALTISGNIGKHSGYIDLKNTVIEILADANKCYFNLSDLEFIDKKEGKEGTLLNPEIINQVADCLGLQFLSEKTAEGNVCFINSTELRPEFRQSFTSIEVLDYCYAVLHLPINEISGSNSEMIPITSDSSVFRKLVKCGCELRKEDLLSNL